MRKSQVKTSNVFILDIKYIRYTNKLGLDDHLCHGFLIGISYLQGDTKASLIGCCVTEILKHVVVRKLGSFYRYKGKLGSHRQLGLNK